MTNYTDYNFYENTYMGNMPEDDFDILVIRASAEIRKYIFNRDITGYENDVQMATCSVADILYEIKQAQQRKNKLVSSNNSEKIVASESVADLSITYANANSLIDLDKEISNQKAKIKDEIRLYLLHTDLLFRGV